MTQTKAVAEINKFVGGFVSDASPLTFPENTSLVDINMDLNTDGSRKRALGIDLEDHFVEINTGVTSATTTPIGYNTFKWENVNGNPNLTVLCVQIANTVRYFKLDGQNISTKLIGSQTFPLTSYSKRYSFASVDGSLVIATGSAEVSIVEYDGTSFTFSSKRIKVRDFFGVEDKDKGQDLTIGSGVQVRPVSLSQPHLYNLRNQGFAIPRMDRNNEVVQDTIKSFKDFSGKFPSNSDSVIPFLYADANDSGDRNSRRFFANDATKNPLGSGKTANGHYIIDLLNRGESRLAEEAKTRANYTLVYTLATLPADYTPGGATVVGEFAGRVWYGGFDGQVVNGDEKSPKLSSYIAFSQLVIDPSMITECYQEGDPTSDESPDIIDTDGGYIRLNNAYGVCSIVNLGKSLFICAQNGVWRIFGSNDKGFTATNYVVDKVTDKGVRGPGTVVQVENTLVYWSDDGIYWLKQNEFGDWISENQTQGRIQKFYNEIPASVKEKCVGVYDGYQRKVRWLYNNVLNKISQQKELVFDVNLNAFYERHFSQISGNTVPVILGGFNNTPFRIKLNTENVTVGSSIFTVGGSNVTITTEVKATEGALFEIGYVIVTNISPTVKITFGAAIDTTWTDWKSINGVGVDAPATLITGSATGGDTIRFKQVPYLYVHSRRTENGFVLDGNGDFVPKNQSSCTVQSIWDWTNSINSNKWGTPFQAYRYKRPYFPVDVNDDFDTGHETIVTKNKLRGRGRAISLKFTSSPGKEMYLYGWSMILAANNNV